ncbi:PREDICTED: alpha-tocopherol transfer protein [Nicrophorus vespilloides]|uniref:Alpha-tocopherol transfer protein n=1 Tax=Nicrophorus vespilloides TaxID=110193 RepID=A0ABM1MZT5_NICVS|nr:PREDICTED: alpha-tocopherol transfer protein [Nicrophorus vespilloides]
MDYEWKLDEDARKFAEENLKETEEKRTRFVAEIRSWYDENPEINGCRDADAIVPFLRGCKFDLERAKIKLRNYYKMRQETPQWFANRDPELEEIQELVNLGVFVPMRKLHENRLVVIIKTAAHDPGKHKQDDVFKAGKMILDVAAKEQESAQIYGVTAIFDMTGVSLGHARQLPPKVIKKAVFAWQNYHCRPKQLEFVNAPLYINVVLNVFKSFMSEKLKGRVRVHFKGQESLHQVIDKEVLPEEYGGTDGPLSEHITYWRDKLIEYKDWFKYDEQFKSKLD